MEKKVLSEQALYFGYLDMPKGFEIDRDKLSSDTELTVDNLHEVSQLIKSIENRMGHKIGCIEEIALKNRWITKRYLKKTTKKYCNSEYGIYVDSLND